MRSLAVSATSAYLQSVMYTKLNDFSKSHPFLGRLGVIPISVIDVSIEISTPLVRIIESLLFAAFNLIGKLFSYNYVCSDSTTVPCTIKGVIVNLQEACIEMSAYPLCLAFAPIYLIYQIVETLFHPQTARSVNPCPKLADPEGAFLISC